MALRAPTSCRILLNSDYHLPLSTPEFKRALEAFIAKAEEKGLLTEEQAERMLARVKAGPNAVEIAGVEFNVQPTWKGTRLKTIEITYKTSDRDQFEESVKALEEFDLLPGADFAAEWDGKGRVDIWLKAGAFDKAVEALKGAGLKEEDFTVKRAKGGGGMIRIKNPKDNLEGAREAFKKAGLVEDRDYTVYGGRGEIRLAMPEALWTIAWKAIKEGDARAQAALNQLLKVAERLGIKEYFEERIRPVLLAGVNNAVGRKMTVKGFTVEIKDFKVAWVSLKDKKKPCNWPEQLCRPRVIISYRLGGEERSFSVTWGVDNTGAINANVNVENKLDRAAALIAVAVWESDEEEKRRIVGAAKRGGYVELTLDNLLAIDASLLEWAMRVKRATGKGDTA